MGCRCRRDQRIEGVSGKVVEEREERVRRTSQQVLDEDIRSNSQQRQCGA